jgi:hypothetical protein
MAIDAEMTTRPRVGVARRTLMEKGDVRIHCVEGIEFLLQDR